MKLAHIDRKQLSISAANMRAGRKPPDISDILPSVRSRGILVPLLVRPANDDEERFEIVAGRRRFFAAEAVTEERLATGDTEAEASPLPCAIMEAGDDAAALEASLIENVARADPHEVEQWETFTRLVAKEGRKPDEIAATFGLTERQVRQVLALGNLLPKIRDLYRREEIDGATVRLLTMASKARQKEWLALLADPDTYTPMGQQLKSWLFGGASVPTSAALFDLDSYPGAIVTDLFGEGGYFADAGQFWEAQNAAIEERRAAYLENGWSEVVVFEPGQYFHSWEYEKAPKRKGGKVYAVVSTRGEVAFHEGFVSRKEAERARRAKSGADDASAAKPARSEVTGTMQTYIDLHRHAAVRTAMLGHPAVALRLMAAHVIAGSYLFAVRPEPQRGGSNAVTESVETSAAETAFDQKRREALALLGFDADTPTLIGGSPFGGGFATAAAFARLLELSDEEVAAVIAVAMGEALESGSSAVELLGLHLGVDMGAAFTPDDTLFELIRDKEVLTGMIADLAGSAVAEANAKEKAKAQKAIIRDCLAGANGREKVEGWVPRWMAFPPAAYTERGGVGSVSRHAEIARLIEPEPGPEAAATDAELTAPQDGGNAAAADEDGTCDAATESGGAADPHAVAGDTQEPLAEAA